MDSVINRSVLSKQRINLSLSQLILGVLRTTYIYYKTTKSIKTTQTIKTEASNIDLKTDTDQNNGTPFPRSLCLLLSYLSISFAIL